MILVLLSGCSQVFNSPMNIAGAAVSTTIDFTGSAVRAFAGSDDEDEKED